MSILWVWESSPLKGGIIDLALLLEFWLCRIGGLLAVGKTSPHY